MTIHRFPGVEVRSIERELVVDGQPVALGARAFDLLLALIDGGERLLAKSELLDRVWPGLVVEENNLQVQISTLRKALGPHAIATVPGRGYRLALAPIDAPPVKIASATPPAVPPQLDAVVGVRSNLPAHTAPLFGREADVLAVEELLHRHPLVTIAGAGGMGKTRLAQGVATRVGERFPDGAWWIELAALGASDLVGPAVARVLGVHIGGERSLRDGIVTVLKPQHALLVLDNCEHVLDEVATLVDAICAGAPHVRLLVTSQEPLKTSEEHVYRLGSLAVPSKGGPVRADDFGALELFIARARAVLPRFEADARALPAIAEICSRLDGIPLAIELAVARLPLLGLEGLRLRLDERFKVLTGGSRMLLRRHQTLRATLEWSHNLLAPHEQAVLRRLGVFAGSFTLDSAQAVAHDAAIDEWAVLESLGALVDKSLVLAEGGHAPRYRLLETTRAYALERLGDAGETATTLRRHALALATLLRRYEDDVKRWRPIPEDRAALAAEVDSLRAAMTWAQEEDATLLLELAAHSSNVWIYAGLNVEGMNRCAAARECLRPETPLPVQALFWLTSGRLGIVTGRKDCFEAAGRAIELYRKIGDESRLYDALATRASVGAERLEVEAAGAAIAEGEGLDGAPRPPRQRATFMWAKARWLRAAGRLDDALAAVLQQAAIYREDRFELGEAIALGANVAAYEIQLGRAEEAEVRARAALATVDRLGANAMSGHIRHTLMLALALQGRSEEALEQGRLALPLLTAEGDEMRLLEGLALVAAQQGRFRDAACVIGFGDATHQFRNLPGAVTRRHRERVDALLRDALPAADAAACRSRGAALSEADIMEVALGDAAGGA